MELLMLVIGLIVLDLFAIRFGYDSRDGIGATDHETVTSGMGWSDPTHDDALAREIQEARQRRIAHSRAVDTELQQVSDELAQAA